MHACSHGGWTVLFISNFIWWCCADVYTSRVSNFLRYTPYAYFRSPSQSLAHDRSNISPRSSALSYDCDSSGSYDDHEAGHDRH